MDNPTNFKVGKVGDSVSDLVDSFKEKAKDKGLDVHESDVDHLKIQLNTVQEKAEQENISDDELGEFYEKAFGGEMSKEEEESSSVKNDKGDSDETAGDIFEVDSPVYVADRYAQRRDWERVLGEDLGSGENIVRLSVTYTDGGSKRAVQVQASRDLAKSLAGGALPDSDWVQSSVSAGVSVRKKTISVKELGEFMEDADNKVSGFFVAPNRSNVLDLFEDKTDDEINADFREIEPSLESIYSKSRANKGNITMVMPSPDDTKQRDPSSDEVVIVSPFEDNYHNFRAEVHSSFDAKEDIKDLDWDRTHRQYDKGRDAWTVDLTSVDYVKDQLEEDYEVKVSDRVRDKAEMVGGVDVFIVVKDDKVFLNSDPEFKDDIKSLSKSKSGLSWQPTEKIWKINKESVRYAEDKFDDQGLSVKIVNEGKLDEEDQVSTEEEDISEDESVEKDEDSGKIEVEGKRKSVKEVIPDDIDEFTVLSKPDDASISRWTKYGDRLYINNLSKKDQYVDLEEKELVDNNVRGFEAYGKGDKLVLEGNEKSSTFGDMKIFIGFN